MQREINAKSLFGKNIVKKMLFCEPGGSEAGAGRAITSAMPKA
jgi:hypothetical protein